MIQMMTVYACLMSYAELFIISNLSPWMPFSNNLHLLLTLLRC